MIEHGAEINVPRKGNVLICARDWGEIEELEGRPLVGLAGQLTDEMLSYGGWRREDVNLTNVVPETRPPYDDFRKHNPRDVENGRRALDKLVKRLKPSLIITMGNEAAYHFVPDWPTGGRGIFGAKGIEDRRGYFWETEYGWVYTVLHPAGALRKIVPGYELLRRDFRRARRWLRGKLPRQEFPEVKTLSSSSQVRGLLRSKGLAFDIETWRGKQVFCCGFTGDNFLPYVAKYGRGFKLMEQLLNGRKGLRGIAHNGPYDVDLLDRADFPTMLYTDDTQALWGNALEPELAFRDEQSGGRLTRKGLVSLASLHPNLNVPFWKQAHTRPGFPDWISGYPEESDNPDELSKLYLMGGRDSYITRRLWDWLWKEVKKVGAERQYRLAFETNLRCITMVRRGWLVDERLRQERIKVLDARMQESREQARQAGLVYIKKHQIERFKVTKQCKCCGGGEIARDQCWRCAGFETKPTKKMLEERLGGNGRLLKAALEELVLNFCEPCLGRGEVSHFEYNPHSRDQQMALFYDYVGAPKWVFKGETHFDEMARLRLLRWAEGG